MRIATKKTKFSKKSKKKKFEKNFNDDKIDYVMFFTQQFVINKRFEQKRLFKITKIQTKIF